MGCWQAVNWCQERQDWYGDDLQVSVTAECLFISQEVSCVLLLDASPGSTKQSFNLNSVTSDWFEAWVIQLHRSYNVR
jgi:hypothetical protein